MPRLHKNKLPTIGENTNYKGSRGDGPLREIFSNNHINNLTYCKTSKKLKNIDRSCSHLDRSKFTKDLIDFIKKDFSDEKDFGHEEEIINILNRLPLSGSENQDKELIEIAFELCNAEMEEKTDTHLEIEKKDLAINSDLKNSLKEKIKNLDRNKDNFDFFDQFCRTGEDALKLSVTALTEILIFPFELCLGRDTDKSTPPPKTIIRYIEKTDFSELKQL